MPGIETPPFPQVSEEARDYINKHPHVRQAWARCYEIGMTLERIWRPDPNITYGGAPRTKAELQEARDLIPVREYLTDLHKRLAARAHRRALRVYAELVRKSEFAAERLAA